MKPDKWLVIDLETTGTNFQKDKIIQISSSWIGEDWGLDAETQFIDPQMPIPAASMKIHHITDEMVKGKPVFADVAEAAYEKLDQAKVLVGYSVSFDLQMINREFKESLGKAFSFEKFKFLDPYIMWTRSEPRRLEDAVRRFVGDDPTGMHDAEKDCSETVRVLKAMLEGGLKLPEEDEKIYSLSHPVGNNYVTACGRLRWDDEGEAVIAFGQNKGRSLRALADDNPGYLKWIIKKDFSDDLKEIVSQALEGKFPKKGS